MAEFEINIKVAVLQSIVRTVTYVHLFVGSSLGMVDGKVYRVHR